MLSRIYKELRVLLCGIILLARFFQSLHSFPHHYILLNEDEY
jgi:hypothetical protein